MNYLSSLHGPDAFDYATSGDVPVALVQLRKKHLQHRIESADCPHAEAWDLLAEASVELQGHWLFVILTTSRPRTSTGGTHASGSTGTCLTGDEPRRPFVGWWPTTPGRTPRTEDVNSTSPNFCPTAIAAETSAQFMTTARPENLAGHTLAYLRG